MLSEVDSGDLNLKKVRDLLHLDHCDVILIDSSEEIRLKLKEFSEQFDIEVGLIAYLAVKLGIATEIKSERVDYSELEADLFAESAGHSDILLAHRIEKAKKEWFDQSSAELTEGDPERRIR